MSTHVNTYTEVQSIHKNEVIKRYLPLVKKIAHHLVARLPKSIYVEDLIQSGVIGLMEAADNYDPTRGASFETYATIRIRGTMLDEVRKNDWLPRSIYRNSRMINEATQQVENQTGRDPKDSEVANKLGVSLSAYQNMLAEINAGQVYAFEDIGIDDDVLFDHNNVNFIGPYDGLQRHELVSHISKAVDTLSEREKIVLSLYYDEEMNLKEIGDVLEVSESRVCQIHSQAMAHLKSKLDAWTK